MSETSIQNAIQEFRKEISNLDDALIMEVVGVAQAIAELRKALDELDNRLNEREYEAAARFGYEDISSNFIFLQRTLGGLQQQVHHKSELISRIAVRSGVGVYEEVAPYVDEILLSSKPRYSEDYRKLHEANIERFRQLCDQIADRAGQRGMTEEKLRQPFKD